eukprot:TRINITY_DN19725_c0_g1_i1.p1 TRINITY_DN19725_c0_g1~~TRINITY_DN19725_c0_g1_i1.p1  ORF type:complete len:129 (+),score=7.33 TRINITY_DN19725_c0_g1_i1:59-445(+)
MSKNQEDSLQERCAAALRRRRERTGETPRRPGGMYLKVYYHNMKPSEPQYSSILQEPVPMSVHHIRTASPNQNPPKIDYEDVRRRFIQEVTRQKQQISTARHQSYQNLRHSNPAQGGSYSSVVQDLTS